MLRWKATLLLVPSEALANEAWCTPPAVRLPSIAFPPPPPPVHAFQLRYAWLHVVVQAPYDIATVQEGSLLGISSFVCHSLSYWFWITQTQNNENVLIILLMHIFHETHSKCVEFLLMLISRNQQEAQQSEIMTAVYFRLPCRCHLAGSLLVWL